MKKAQLKAMNNWKGHTYLVSLLVVLFPLSLFGQGTQTIRVNAKVTGVWYNKSDGDCAFCDGADMTWKTSGTLYLGGKSEQTGDACIHKADKPSKNNWFSQNNEIFNYSGTPTNNVDMCDLSDAYIDFKVEGWENDRGSSCSYDSKGNGNLGGGDDHYESSTLKVQLASLSGPGSNNARQFEKDYNGYKVRITVWYEISGTQYNLSITDDGGQPLPDFYCAGEEINLTLNPGKFRKGSVNWDQFDGSWKGLSQEVDKYSVKVNANENVTNYRVRTEHVQNSCIGEVTNFKEYDDVYNGVIFPSPPTDNNISFSSTNACVGQTNGSLTINFSGSYNSNDEFRVIIEDVNDTDNRLTQNFFGNELPYTYNSLSPGTYRAIITRKYRQSAGFSADGDCTFFSSKTHTVQEERDAQIGQVIKKDVVCKGDGNGQIVAYVDYTNKVELWKDGSLAVTRNNPFFSETFNNLSGGSYEVRAFNAVGCFVSKTVTVGEAAALPSFTTQESQFDGGNLNIACKNGTGSIRVSPSGGQAPYRVTVGGYVKSGIQSGNDALFDFLRAGTYTVTLRDAFGCETSQNVTLIEPTTSPSITVDSTVATTGCSNTGEVFLSASGGTGAYKFAFDDQNFASVISFNNLSRGRHVAWVEDGLGCINILGVDIPGPDTFLLSTGTGEVSCFEAGDGSVTANVSGGVLPITIKLFNDQNTEVGSVVANSANPSQQFTSLSGGGYTVRVEDAENCIIEEGVSVFEPLDYIITNVSVVQPVCKDDEPELVMTVFGRGSDRYTETSPDISYDGGSYTTFGAEDLFITNGPYRDYKANNPPSSINTIQLRDFNGCETNLFTGVGIVNPASIQITIPTSTQPSCFGDVDGSIDVNVTGGRAPFEVTLDLVDQSLVVIESRTIILDAAGTLTFDGLQAAGNEGSFAGYDIEVKDNFGNPESERCIAYYFGEGAGNASGPFVLDQPGSLTVGEPNSTGPALNCATNNGEVTINASGGTPTYQYSSNGVNFQASNVLTGLDADPKVWVRDANGCIDTISGIPMGPINNPLSIPSPTTSQAASSCTPEIFSVNPSGNDGNLEVTLVSVSVVEIDVTPLFEGSVQIVNGATPQVTVDYHDYDAYPPGTVFNMEFDAIDDGTCTASFSYNYTLPDTIAINVSNVTGETCLGDADGSLSVSATGGVAPYTIRLNLVNDQSVGEGANANYSNLTSGTYVVSVEDATGCVQVTVAEIGIASPIIVSETTDFSGNCADEAVGNLSFSITGGSAPYTVQYLDNFGNPDGASFSLNAGQSASKGNLPSADLDATIVDASGCEVLETFNLDGGPTWIEVTLQETVDPGCGGNDGLIRIRTVGGTGALQVSLNAGAFTSDTVFTNLSGGDNTITVQDALGCTVDTVFTLAGAGSFTPAAQVTDVTCNGENTGSITVTVDPTGSYTYKLNNGVFQSNNTFSNLSAGSYTVTVKGSDDCEIALNNVVVSEPLAISAVLSTTQEASCSSPGSISAIVSGGTAPYTYSWDNGIDTDSILDVATAGEHTLVITDANGCSISETTTLALPDNPSLQEVAILGEACDQADGSVSYTASGGTGPYTYSLNGQTNATGLFENLVAGTYTIRVFDAGGCGDSTSVTVPALPGPTLSELSVEASNCNASTGTASVSVNGGNGVLTYSWSHDINLNSTIATGLAPGSYTVTVTDERGCSDQLVLLVPEAERPTATASQSVESKCGQDNGIAVVSLSGGETPFSYDWSHNAQLNAATAQGLSPGNYTVIVTDNNNCADTASFTIGEIPGPTISNANISPETCGQQDGSIVLSLTDGQGPFVYTWSHSASVLVGEANNLTAGTYTVSVEDANGCTDTLPAIVVTGTPGPTLALDQKTDASCEEGNGSITVIASGGQTPYSYAWDHNGGITGASATDLEAGTYTVTITDANGCTDQVVETIVDANLLSIDQVNTVNSACGQSNGSATIAVSGGIGGYTYSWSQDNNLDSPTATGLPSGAYTVTVTDGVGCVVSTVANVIDDEAPIVSLTDAQNSTCGQANGQITVNVTDGNTPYVFSWSQDNNLNNTTADNLPAGTYTFTVVDAQGCQASLTQELTEPDPIELQLVNTQEVACLGDANGGFEVLASQGTPGYNYSWGTGQTGATISGLAAGTYEVVATDAEGCTANLSLNLTNPTELLLTPDTILGPSCDGNVGGVLTVGVAGGEGPYSFLWNDPLGQTSATALNLTPGTYTATVTDKRGCVKNIQMEVPDVEELRINLSSLELPSCFGEATGSISVTVDGGDGAYAFLWDDPRAQNTATASNLPAGMYSLQVSNLDGTCPTNASFELTQPDSLAITESVLQDVSCFGANDGATTLGVTGGTTPYAVSWADGPTGLSRTGLAGGTYTATVVDSNGCTTPYTIEINEPDSILVSAIVTQPTCELDATGQIQVDVTGGTTPYTYAWPPTDTVGSVRTGLTAGFYDVVVTDSSGCTANQTILVESVSPAIFIDTVSFQTPSCVGSGDGSIDVFVSGGVGDLSLAWSTGDTVSTLNGLDSGFYQLTVTDSVGCSQVASFDFTNVEDFNFEVAQGDTAICLGQTVLIGEDSVAGRTYSWTGPNGFSSTESLIAVTQAGDYIVNVTQSTCTATDTVQVIEASAALQALFIIPTQVIVNDTVIALEVSWPVPDSVIWTYPTDSVVFLGRSGNQQLFQFPYQGSFPIGMQAFLSGCEGSVNKVVNVFPDSASIQLPTDFGNKQILAMNILPNPNTGVFTVAFELNNNSTYTLRVFDAVGTIYDTRTGTGSGELTEDYSLSLTSGAYVVQLTAEIESLSLVFLVE